MLFQNTIIFRRLFVEEKTLIKFHHMSITKALQDYAKSKLHRIEKFDSYIVSVSIDLDVNHLSSNGQQQEASALVHVHGSTIKASASSDSMYASIDLMMDKLDFQLTKYKDKLKSHRAEPKHQSTKGTFKRSVSVKKALEKGDRFIRQPMDPEEAASILERENINVIVFRNLSDECVNVIYRLDEDRTYGLIEAK
jgi:putative sigma-54 modulation protein